MTPTARPLREHASAQHAGAPASAITLHARATPGFDERVAHAVALLQVAATEHAGRIVQATSLGAEDMVLTDLIAQHRIGIRLTTLDTGQLHDETLALIPRIEQRYGLVVQRYAPVTESALRFVRTHGELAMRQSIDLRQACCAIRKLEPLSRMMSGASAWVTGLRRDQSGARAVVPFSERDGAERTKFNPLADWSWADVWHYIATHEVPYNPLHDQFMPSIGCAPCTRAIAVGEDFRSGRWWWESASAKECGLHVSPRSDGARGAATTGHVSAQGLIDAADVKTAQAAGRSQSAPARARSLHVKNSEGTPA